MSRLSRTIRKTRLETRGTKRQTEARLSRERIHSLTLRKRRLPTYSSKGLRHIYRSPAKALHRHLSLEREREPRDQSPTRLSKHQTCIENIDRYCNSGAFQVADIKDFGQFQRTLEHVSQRLSRTHATHHTPAQTHESQPADPKKPPKRCEFSIDIYWDGVRAVCVSPFAFLQLTVSNFALRSRRSELDRFQCYWDRWRVATIRAPL